MKNTCQAKTWQFLPNDCPFVYAVGISVGLQPQSMQISWYLGWDGCAICKNNRVNAQIIPNFLVIAIYFLPRCM